MGGPVTRKPLVALHDLELVRLASAGERAAFGELVRRHGALVRALLRRMGADPATADDVAQDAFLTAYERIAEFRGEGTFGGWVRRIAARLYVRRARRRLRLEGPVPDDVEDAGGEGEGAAADRLDLDGALGELAHAERLCLSMCYGAGLTHAEIAEALNTPLGTVKSHVKRGLEKLRRRLEDPRPRRAFSPSGKDGAMSEVDFDRHLQRLFCEAPHRPDGDLFAAQVRDRLDRAWTLRRFLIGAAGAGGGTVALWQLAGSAAVARVAELSRLPSFAAWRQGLHALAQAPALRALPFSGEIVWLMGGLLLVAVGLVATRVVDEF